MHAAPLLREILKHTRRCRCRARWAAKPCVNRFSRATLGLERCCCCSSAMELAFLATNYSNLFFLVLAFSAVVGVLRRVVVAAQPACACAS